MKLIKLLSVAVCAFALVAGSSIAEEGKKEAKITKGSCCEKAKTAGKECSHPCCVKEAKDKKVCTKCNKQEKEEAAK